MSGKPIAAKPKAGLKASPRTTIEIQGARLHNLKNVSLELPRDSLIVFTGLSGSGKSSLAFDTIYAEGQRRYLESLSSFAKRFVSQVAKPDVDFVFGLSPVISIEQKTIGSNPRSTVATMTDIASYLNLLFATIGEPHCPRTGERVASRTANQILEAILSLPEGSEIELRAPVFKVYGEELDFVFTEVRKKGCRQIVIDGKRFDISDELSIDEDDVHDMDAVVDRFVVGPRHEKAIKAGIAATLLVGDGLMRIELAKGAGKDVSVSPNVSTRRSAARRIISSTAESSPSISCSTIRRALAGPAVDSGSTRSPTRNCWCPIRSAAYAAAVSCAKHSNTIRTPGTAASFTACPRRCDSLSIHRGRVCRTPCAMPSSTAWMGRNSRSPCRRTPRSSAMNSKAMKSVSMELRGESNGTTGGIGSAPKPVRAWKRGWTRSWWSARAPIATARAFAPRGCSSPSRAKPSRIWATFTSTNSTPFLGSLKLSGRGGDAGRQVVNEMRGRLDLLLGIGLDYLNLNRRSGTLSGGESQRIRLSTQIGSGLMGMLYVLDEPSIGLHPKDNVKMIATLESLRDIGNTVIVVEHDEDTIRAADHIVEMGPGPGVHGGQVVVQGTLDDVMACKASPTGEFFSGKRSIAMPRQRRKGRGKTLIVRGARENNLKNVDVSFPLGKLIAVTGASGSGKSTLVNEILYKALWKGLVDTRTLPGDHDGIEGTGHVHKVVNIDQSPIGRNSRSNPATYIGFYDSIRELFARDPLSVERGYKSGRFSFNVKGGRCEECQGEGVITTQLYFMPDVEVICGVCKGARFGSETLEVTVRGKTITDVLNMSVEEGVGFFADEPPVCKKIEVLSELGLGYLTLGQSATTLSGGEAQRIKIASELSKLQRSKHTLYILDEPTTGLHLADVERLLQCLNRLVDAGHTVLVIEHHLDVIKTADHVIDLGPEGGHAGGEVW